MPDFPWTWLVVILLVAVVVLRLAHHAGMLDGFVDALASARDRLLTMLGLGDDSLVGALVGGEVDNALRRMWPLWLLFVACFAVVLFLNPAKAGLILYGIGKLALAGPLGYLIDYCATPRKDRPENQDEGIGRGLARKNRTLVICATILALAFGVP